MYRLRILEQSRYITMDEIRDAVLLLTMGRYDPFAVEVCEKTLRQSFSVMNTTLKKTVVLPDTDRADCENSSIFAKAQEIAIEIAREL